MHSIPLRLALPFLLAYTAAAGDVLAPSELASHTPAGLAGNGSSEDPAISADGRYVAFWSQTSDLVPEDTNGNYDVFLRDNLTGTVELISKSPITGESGNGPSTHPAISADGRYVCFQSGTSNLVDPPSSGIFQIFLRDRLTGTNEVVSVSGGGAHANNTTEFPAISADGRFVAFASYADNLVAVDPFNGVRDLFLRDRLLGTTILVSTDPSGGPSNGNCLWPALSGDGRYVAFGSQASNLIPGGTTLGGEHIYVYDRIADALSLASSDPTGNEADGQSYDPDLSDDGNWLAFTTEATNLLPGNIPGNDVVLRHLPTGALERANVNSLGEQLISAGFPSLSSDGRFVAFYGPGLLSAQNGNLVVRDRLLDQTLEVCANDDGSQPTSLPSGTMAAISADGTTVAMTVWAPLVAADGNFTADIYVRGIGAPVRYGTPKMNSLGCLPTIEFSGEARVSNGFALTVSSSSVRNNKTGLLIHGVAGPQAKPFGGGLLCVAQGKRSALVSSGGAPPPVVDCSGSWSLDLGTVLAASPLGPGVGAGSALYLQWWGRDTPNTVQLSDALQVVVGP